MKPNFLIFHAYPIPEGCTENQFAPFSAGVNQIDFHSITRKTKFIAHFIFLYCHLQFVSFFFVIGVNHVFP